MKTMSLVLAVIIGMFLFGCGDNVLRNTASHAEELESVLLSGKYVKKFYADDGKINYVALLKEDMKADGFSDNVIVSMQKIINATNAYAKEVSNNKGVVAKFNIKFDEAIRITFKSIAKKVRFKSVPKNTSVSDIEPYSNIYCYEVVTLMSNCPDGYIYYGQVWNSEQQIINHLLSIGYHKTGSQFGSEYDYTMPLYTACGYGIVRYQALIKYQWNGIWTFMYQKDLNPEIYTYIWPYWWWGGYIAFWHQVC